MDIFVLQLDMVVDRCSRSLLWAGELATDVRLTKVIKSSTGATVVHDAGGGHEHQNSPTVQWKRGVWSDESCIKGRPVAVDVDVTLTRCTSCWCRPCTQSWRLKDGSGIAWGAKQPVWGDEFASKPPKSLAGPTHSSETSKDVLLTFWHQEPGGAVLGMSMPQQVRDDLIGGGVNTMWGRWS